jgi:hypothetical protein
MSTVKSNLLFCPMSIEIQKMRRQLFEFRPEASGLNFGFQFDPMSIEIQKWDNSFSNFGFRLFPKPTIS